MATEYINNKDLYEELKIYRKAYLLTVEQGAERPPIPNSIAYAIDRIANKLTNSFRFVNYPYREEMVGDAILKCLSKIHLFDPERSENPFAYITQIAWNAIIYRIKCEQNETSIKARLIKERLTSDFAEQSFEDEEVQNSFVSFLKENEVYVDYNEERAKKNKDKKSSIHPALVHRNKTPAKTKKVEVESAPKDSEFDLTQFEG